MNNQDLLLFIHGLGGSPEGTWSQFAGLIEKDNQLSQFDIGYYSYPTALWRGPFSRKTPRIQTLALGLRTQIDRKFTQYDRIHLVCHSLGGLIARKYLLEEIENSRKLRIGKVFLYAVPNNGSEAANVGKNLSFMHWQLRQLSRNSDFILELNNDWKRERVSDNVDVRYIVAGQDEVVTEHSAQAEWGNDKVDVVIDKGHRTVVKPVDHEDMSYLILKSILKPSKVSSAKQPGISSYKTSSYERFDFNGGSQSLSSGRYKIVGFDLDGTLLKGMEFSWTLVWDYLGFPQQVRREGMRRYRAQETTYAEWCEWAIQQFKTKGLSRKDFAEITKGLTLTKNFEKTLNTLRADGIIVAIVSGGINVFIEEKIPNAHQWFDFIFINRLFFDSRGRLDRVNSTPFDFRGKATALRLIAESHGLTMEDVAFVGEGFNDSIVAEEAGLSIAYPPTSQAMRAISNISIEEDNLELIIQYILQG